MTITLAVSLLIALALVVISITGSRGIPDSVSESYYSLGEKGWQVQVLLFAVAVTLYPVWVSVSEPNLSWLVFLACSGITFIVVAPKFKQSMEGKVHYTFAAVCCLSSLFWQIYSGLWDVTAGCMFVWLILLMQSPDKWCWWFELCVMASVYLNIFRLI